MTPKTTGIAFAAWALLSTNVSAITIDLVPVGNPGNAPDTRYNHISVGAVAYTYDIGKYEITAGQYTVFLNAVAKSDPNGLYNTKMANTALGILGTDIQRSGSSGSYSYSVPSDWADRPVNYVSLWDAARFANWLTNNQPTGSQGTATTESGSYHGIGTTDFGRSAGAKFFIPTEDEWYKAAYHDKGAGKVGTYFDYPTGTNAVPGNDVTEATNPGNNMNYDVNNGYAIGAPYYWTVAGEFGLSRSPYGTFDQGGNVFEMTETIVGGMRISRGGSLGFSNPSLMSASERVTEPPTNESGNAGFRIASVETIGASIGDFNADGQVDAADYVAWRNGLGTTYTQNDYSIWRSHFGQSSTSDASELIGSSVPEPPAMVPLIVAIRLAQGRRRFSRNRV